MLKKTGVLDVLQSSKMCQPVYRVRCSSCGQEGSATQREIDNPEKVCHFCEQQLKNLKTEDLTTCLSFKRKR